MAGEKAGTAVWAQAQAHRIIEKLRQGESLNPAELAFLDVQKGYIRQALAKAQISEAELDFNTERWIKAVLANDEASSDEELVKLFMEEGGLTEEEARAWIAKRQEYLTKLRPDEAAVSEAQGWADKYSDEQLRTMLRELKAELSHAESAEKKADLERRIAATKEEMKRRTMAMDEALIRAKKTYTTKEAKAMLDKIDKLDKVQGASMGPIGTVPVGESIDEGTLQSDFVKVNSKLSENPEWQKELESTWRRYKVQDFDGLLKKDPWAARGVIEKGKSLIAKYESVEKVNEASDAPVDIAKAALLLVNPKLKEPHAQRIEFLRSKGMTDAEIEQAIKLATQDVKEGQLDEDWKKMLATGALAAVLLASPLADKAKAADADDIADFWNFLGTTTQTMSQTNPKYRKQGDAVVTTQNNKGTLADIINAITGKQTTRTMEDKLDDFLEANPNPTEAQINQFAYDNNYNVDVVKAKIYQWAAQRAREYESIKEMCKPKGRLREMQLGGKVEEAVSEASKAEAIKLLNKLDPDPYEPRPHDYGLIQAGDEYYVVHLPTKKIVDKDGKPYADMPKDYKWRSRFVSDVDTEEGKVPDLKGNAPELIKKLSEKYGLTEALRLEIEEEPAGTIADLEKRDDLELVTRDSDVQAIKDYLGGMADDYDGFFVKIEDGEYTEIYGFEGTVPDLDKEVTKLIIVRYVPADESRRK